MASNTPIECCICMENMDTQVNCMTTSCGHCFHSSCFIKNTAYNGYNCPLCRTKMIDEPEIDDDDDDDESYISEDEREDTEEEVFQSFRWFHQRLHDEDLEEDVEGFSEAPSNEELQEEETIRKENEDQVNLLVSKLKDINKLSYEKLLAAFLYNNVEDFTYNVHAESVCYEVQSMIESVHRRSLRNNTVE